MGKSKDDIAIVPSELLRFIFTGKVITGRDGSKTKYKRFGLRPARNPLGDLIFITGRRVRKK